MNIKDIFQKSDLNVFLFFLKKIFWGGGGGPGSGPVGGGLGESGPGQNGAVAWVGGGWRGGGSRGGGPEAWRPRKVGAPKAGGSERSGPKTQKKWRPEGWGAQNIALWPQIHEKTLLERKKERKWEREIEK